MKRWIVVIFIFIAHLTSAQTCGWLHLFEETVDSLYLYPAQVYVDGVYCTDLPATVALNQGKHKLLIKKQMFQDYETELEIAPETRRSLSVKLVRNGRCVDVLCRDTTALVYVDGNLVAQGGTRVDLTYGLHHVKAIRKYCYPSEQEFEISSITDSVILSAPRRMQGSFVVMTDKDGASVYLDGKLVGQTPLDIKEMPAGDYRVSIAKEGYADQEHMVSVLPDEETKITCELDKLETLLIKTNAYDPEVAIDGKIVSGTKVQVPKGRYPIELNALGYRSKSRVVDIKEGINRYKCHLIYNYGPQFTDEGIYANLGYQILRYPAIELNAGVDVYPVALEVNLLMGLNRTDYLPVLEDYSYSYKPAIHVGFSLGYNIFIGNRIKIVPLIGSGLMFCTSKMSSDPSESVPSYKEPKPYWEMNYDSESKEYEDYKTLGTYSFVFASKFELGLCSWLSLFVKPSYTLPVLLKNSDVRHVMSMSPQVKKYFKGFDVSVGLNFHSN